MSYVTQNGSGKPAGMSAAIIINGSIIAAVMLSPMVVEQARERDPLKTITVKRHEPPPPPNIEKKVKEAPKLPPIYAPPAPQPWEPHTDLTTTSEPPETPITPDYDGTGDIMGQQGKDEQIEEKIEKVLPELPPIFRAAIRDPKWASLFQPPYPARLLQREIEGSARIRVLIGPDGRVRQANVLSATHPDFGEAAVKQALSKWRFRPATRGGKPVEDWQTLTVRFDIT